MQRKHRFILALILALLVFLFLFLFVFLKQKKPLKFLTLYGNVDVRQVDIGFRVPGQVAELCFEEGDYVTQGMLMATLDKTPYDQEVIQASANIEEIKALFENAEKTLKRRLELIGIGGVSQEELDNAQASYEQLKAQLVQAEATLSVALDHLGYTQAFAPTDGIILTRIREPGSVVEPSNPVFTLSVSSPVWIRAYVDEPHLGEVYYGMPAKIFTDVQGGKVYSGKIGFISPVAEFTPKTVETMELRTDLVYRLRIYADNPDHHLVQGMPVTVRLKLEKKAGEMLE